MRWSYLLAVLAFVLAFVAAGIYQQIQVIVQSPDCGVSECVLLAPNVLWTVVAGLAAAAETLLVSRLLKLLAARFRERRDTASSHDPQ